MENKKAGFEAKKINKYFGRLKVLSGINLKLKPGEFITIFGSNGAGKTTFLKIIVMLLKPNSGNIDLNGVNVNNNPEKFRKDIGFISHNTFLYNELTASENLKFFGKLYNVENCEERINYTLEKVGLQHRKDDIVRNFSRGMQQRLTIARAFLHNPLLLLLDEPYTGLDQKASTILNQILNSYHSEGKIAIITTHNIAHGMEIADRIAVLNNGSLVYENRKEMINVDEFKNVYMKIVSSG